MKKRKKRTRSKKINIKLIIHSIILLLTTISNVLLIINLIKLKDIETLLKTIAIIVLIITNILFIINYIINNFIKKKKKINIVMIIMIIVTLITAFLNYNFYKIYNVFDDMTKNYEEYTLSLVTLASNKVENISDIDDSIGVIEDENIENGYKYAKEILEKNKISEELIKYETYLNIVEALYNGEIKYAFLPSNYVNMFSTDEKYENIDKELKMIHSDTKKVEIEAVNTDANKPFSILLMGVDTLSSSYNADTLLLVTFNPDTLSATMLSIPRDTYTTIACTGGKHKINSSGWYSDNCVVNTVSKLVDIDIDYYVKINFTGIVNLVDALGGIDVDVPYPFCEQNSKRQFGDHLIYVEEGMQHLNGEQALALSRNRKFLTGKCPAKYNEKGYYSNNLRNDITRGLNQQLVFKAMLNAMTEIRDLDTVYSLLDVLGDNISTNMSKDTMLSFYNIFKNIMTTSDLSDIENTFDIQKLGIEVYGTYVNISNMNLSMIVPHQKSINAVSNAMKENLGLKEKETIKTISFNINNPYEEETIGKGIYGGTTLSLLEDLTGKTKDEAQSYCSKIGKTCEFEYVEINDNSHSNNKIIEQSIPANYDISLIRKTIYFKVAKVVNNTNTKPVAFDYAQCVKEEYKDNSNCQIPNFVGKDISEFNTWYKKFTFIKAKTTKVEDSTKVNGIIISQDISNKSIYEIYTSSSQIQIEYISNTIQDNTTPPSDDKKDEEQSPPENKEPEVPKDENTTENIEPSVNDDEKNTE